MARSLPVAFFRKTNMALGAHTKHVYALLVAVLQRVRTLRGQFDLRWR